MPFEKAVENWGYLSQKSQKLPVAALLPLFRRYAGSVYSTCDFSDHAAERFIGRIDELGLSNNLQLKILNFLVEKRILEERLSNFIRPFILRTQKIDAEVSNFIDKHNDCTIVNLGAGLCTRHERIGTGGKLWIEVDFKEMIEYRVTLGDQETASHKFEAGNVFDKHVLSRIGDMTKAGNTLIIAEGLLVYYSIEQNRRLFRNLAHYFPGADMILTYGSGAAPTASKKSVSNLRNKLLGIKQEYNSGVVSGMQLESIFENVELIKEIPYTSDRRSAFAMLIRLI